MSWRDKLHVEGLENGDRSDTSPTSVTSVTVPRDTLVSSLSPLSPEPPAVACTSEQGICWEEWKAAALNQLFQEKGCTGLPGLITAATIKHGARSGHVKVPIESDLDFSEGPRDQCHARRRCTAQGN